MIWANFVKSSQKYWCYICTFQSSEFYVVLNCVPTLIFHYIPCTYANDCNTADHCRNLKCFLFGSFIGSSWNLLFKSCKSVIWHLKIWGCKFKFDFGTHFVADMHSEPGFRFNRKMWFKICYLCMFMICVRIYFVVLKGEICQLNMWVKRMTFILYEI
jgi:hypothetical protein